MRKFFCMGMTVVTSVALAAAVATAQSGGGGGGGAGSGSAAGGGGASGASSASGGASGSSLSGSTAAGSSGTTSGSAIAPANAGPGSGQGLPSQQSIGAGSNATQFGQPSAARQQSTIGAQAPQGAPAQLGAGNQALPLAQPQARGFGQSGDISNVPGGTAGQLRDQNGDTTNLQPGQENSLLRGQPGALSTSAGRGELGVWLVGESSNGVRVGRITPGSAAELAGLLPGDVLLSINGMPVTSPLGVQQIVRGIPVGQSADLIVLRDGRQQQLTATLAAGRSYQTGFRGDMMSAGGDLAARTQRLEEQVGMMIQEMRQLREEMAAMRTSRGAAATAPVTATPPATSLQPSENLFDEQPAAATPSATTIAEPATIPAETEPATDSTDSDLFDSDAAEPVEPAAEAAPPAEPATPTVEESAPAAEAETPAEPEAASDAETETESADESDDLFN